MPLYFVITLAFVAAKLVALGGSTTFVSAWNGFLYLPLFDFNGYTPPPLDVGWTLGFEMWFYLVFTLLLNFLKPRQVAIALPALFLAGAVAMTPYHGAWYFPTFMFHPFVLEFSLGCIVCLIQEHLTGWRPIALLAGGVVYFFLFSRNSDNLGWYTAMFGSHGVELGWQRVLLWGVPAALVTAGLVGLERNHGYVLPRALVYVGGFSYSLYLVHRLVESALVRFGTHLGLHQPLLVIAAMVGLSLLLAWLCWLTLEAPLTHWAQRILKQSHAHPVLFPKPDRPVLDCLSVAVARRTIFDTLAKSDHQPFTYLANALV